MKTVDCLGQPSWRFASDRVEAWITQMGGQLAPVKFRLGSRVVTPFSVAPWAEEDIGPGFPPHLQALRGDFFCAPFGGNEQPYRGETHPPHGEIANTNWKFESLKEEVSGTELHLSIQVAARRGRVDKHLFLRPGESSVYSRHVLSGFSGKMNIGHHAMLKFPDEEGSGNLSMSRIRFGQVVPTEFEVPAQAAGYSSLKTGAAFTALNKVPLANGGFTDLSRYPARRGFEDLVMVTHQDKPDFAWSAVTFPKERYAWIALKDPRVLQSTVLWITNGGRHYPPWNGRHVSVLGVEEVTSYFHLGLAASAAANAVNRRGIATTVALSKKLPLVVNYIMAVVEIPKDFKSVQQIIPENNGVTLVSPRKQRISLPLDLSFLYPSPT